MVTPTNHVIAGPNLHRAGPLALWGFSQDLPAKYRLRKKKVSPSECEAPALCYKINPALVTFIKRLHEGLGSNF